MQIDIEKTKKRKNIMKKTKAKILQQNERNGTTYWSLLRHIQRKILIDKQTFSITFGNRITTIKPLKDNWIVECGYDCFEMTDFRNINSAICSFLFISANGPDRCIDEVSAYQNQRELAKMNNRYDWIESPGKKRKPLTEKKRMFLHYRHKYYTDIIKERAV